MNILLVHGFLNRGRILRRLGRYLESAGHSCFIPSLKPCDARCGLPELAEQLRQYVETSLPADSRYALIGFSMGALVSRYFLQELGGWRRTDAFFSVAGPHSGTVTAYLYPSKGVYEMRPGSDFLAQLEHGAHRLADIPAVCYWTPYDLMVRPVASARWKPAEHVQIPVLLHALLAFDRRLYRDIEQRLSALKLKHTPHQPPPTPPAEPNV